MFYKNAVKQKGTCRFLRRKCLIFNMWELLGSNQ